MPGIKSGNLDPAVRHSPAARQARRHSGLRTNSIAIVVMLLTQYRLGMAVNLYARYCARDKCLRLGADRILDNPILPGQGTFSMQTIKVGRSQAKARG